MPTKIGIVFGPIEELAKETLSFLLLYQNTVQDTFEFRVLSCSEADPFLAMLAHQPGPLHSAAEQHIDTFLSRLETFNTKLAAEYGLRAEKVDKVIVLANTRFRDNYYYIGSEAWAVIALGGWEHEFAPPSLVEYFLTLVAIASLDAIVRPMERHFDTRACAYDFNASLRDARLKVLTGQICEACRTKIEKKTSKKVLEDAITLLKRPWLGSAPAPSDVAITIKKLGYDLFHTAGAKPTFKERCVALLEQEGMKNLLNITFQIILTAALVIIGLKK